MRSRDALPDSVLEPTGALSHALLDRGLTNLRAAASWLQDLPYGRDSDRGDQCIEALTEAA